MDDRGGHMRKYDFYGWETAGDVKAEHTLYNGIITPLDLYDALSGLWCAETCAPRLRAGWTPENRTLGQCSITAFIAQDIFGGEVYGMDTDNGGVHCYNVAGGRTFDLTSEQFGERAAELHYAGNKIQDRGSAGHFQKEEKRKRYEYLKEKLKETTDRRASSMKALIIYYSLEGNTDYTAQKISGITGADMLRLMPEHDYPVGAGKYIVGGKAAVFGDKPVLKAYSIDLSAYDTVMIGTPVWASTFAPPLRSFFSENSIKGKTVGMFACQKGSGAEKCFDKLKKLTGVSDVKARLILIDPKSDPDAGNDSKIDEFCREMMQDG
jgi:flavodoxin